MSIPCGSEAVAPLCSLPADGDGAGYWEVTIRASPWPEIAPVPPSTFLQCLLSLTVRGTAAWSPCHIRQPPNSFHFLPNQLPGRREQPLQQLLGLQWAPDPKPRSCSTHMLHFTHLKPTSNTSHVGTNCIRTLPSLPLGSLCHHLLLSLGFQQQKFLARPLAQDELLP